MNRASFDGLRCLCSIAGGVVVLALAGDCRGEVIASDNASDPAYSDGWQGLKGAVPEETGTDNGGTGFLPWSFDDTFWEADSSPYPQPHFVETQASSSNNLGTPTFALTNGNVAFNGYTTTATRAFATGLKTGNQFSIDLDNPHMQPLEEGDSTGFVIKLQTEDGVERFGFYTTFGFNEDQWTITDSRGDETASGLFAMAGTSGFKLALKLTGDESYQLTVTPRSGGAPLTFEGSLAKAGKGEIKSIQLVMYGNGSGDGGEIASGERELYFNNLLIESSGAPQAIQKPSDCNQDGTLDISDAVCLLELLFQGGPEELPCEGGPAGAGNIALLDANGDAKLDISDAVWFLDYLFKGGASPALGSQCQPIAGCPDNSATCEKP